MRRCAIVFAGLVIAAMAATAALAGTIKLQGTYSAGQIDLACIDNGGTVTAGTGAGGFGCKTDKGEVSCTKEGQCTGTCEKCGARMTGPGKRQLLHGILTDALLSAEQPGGGLQGSGGATLQVQRPVGGTAGGWSAECKSCLDKCDTDYPRGGGPLQTCKDLCKRAGTCPSALGIEGAGGITVAPGSRR
jgi:hypothetical protein